MAKAENILTEGGMKFFGRMSASATHEIKNTLAIINESAGLLEDLSIAADQGIPLSIPRIKNISKMITRQVQRADLILKKLNRFSHSTDQSTDSVDLEKTLYFVLNLADRLIKAHGVTIKITSPLTPLIITTNLFCLENIIWRAIESAYYTAKGKKQILISFEPHLAIISIWFSINTVTDNAIEDLFKSKEDQALLEFLNISIEKNKKNNSFGLLLPKTI